MCYSRGPLWNSFPRLNSRSLPAILRRGSRSSSLASVEADPERAAFLRDFDLKRLPDSCSYGTDLDPAEITLEAAEMCAEQKDWPLRLSCAKQIQGRFPATPIQTLCSPGARKQLAPQSNEFSDVATDARRTKAVRNSQTLRLRKER